MRNQVQILKEKKFKVECLNVKKIFFLIQQSAQEEEDIKKVNFFLNEKDL